MKKHGLFVSYYPPNLFPLSLPCSALDLAHGLPWLLLYADLQFSADPNYKHILSREISYYFRSTFW